MTTIESFENVWAFCLVECKLKQSATTGDEVWARPPQKCMARLERIKHTNGSRTIRNPYMTATMSANNDECSFSLGDEVALFLLEKVISKQLDGGGSYG